MKKKCYLSALHICTVLSGTLSGCQIRKFNNESGPKQYIAQQVDKNLLDTVYWLTKESNQMNQNLCGCQTATQSLADKIAPPTCVEKTQCVSFDAFKKTYKGLLKSERFRSDKRETLKHLNSLAKNLAEQSAEMTAYIDSKNRPGEVVSPEISESKFKIKNKEIEISQLIKTTLLDLQILRTSLPSLQNSFEEIELSLRTQKKGFNLYNSHLLDAESPHLSTVSRLYHKAFIQAGVQNYASSKDLQSITLEDGIKTFNIALKPKQSWSDYEKNQIFPSRYSLLFVGKRTEDSRTGDFGEASENVSNSVFAIELDPNQPIFMIIKPKLQNQTVYNELESRSACLVSPYPGPNFTNKDQNSKKDIQDKYETEQGLNGGTFIAKSNSNSEKDYLFECGFIDKTSKNSNTKVSKGDSGSFKMFGVGITTLSQSKVVNGKIKVFSLKDLENVLEIEQMVPKALFDSDDLKE